MVDRVRKIIKINRPDHPWNELSEKDFFRTAGLFRHDFATGNEGFTMAALLLFGKDEAIQSAIPHYKIDALVRKVDTDRYDDRENIRCNIIEAYDKLMAFVAKHLPDKFYLQNDQRISLRDKIFREIIANMLIHREYTNAYPSTFVIYTNYVETKNANVPHFYGQLLPNTFEPFPKNPHLAQLFTQLGRSEELGTGLRNVFKYSKAYSGSENISFIEENTFVAKIPLTANEQNVVDNVPDSVPDVPDNVPDKRLELIMGLIKNNNKILLKEISEQLNVSQRTVRRDIEKLKSENKLKRVGSEKGGHWQVLK